MICYYLPFLLAFYTSFPVHFPPDDLKTFVDQQVASAAYGTSSGYVRDLICRTRPPRPHYPTPSA